MCGIIGAFDTGKDAKVNSWVVDQYEEQHNRGRQGFGVVGWNGQGKADVKRACTEAKFMFDLHAKNYAFMLAHHRMPTSSMNALDQTHPIAVRHDGFRSDWLVAHNGVIRNCKELRGLHESLGFEYSTAHVEVGYGRETPKFNDSESLAIEVARFAEGKTDKVGTIGSVAFIALELDKASGKVVGVHFGRNTNPLHVLREGRALMLSSEGPGEDCGPNVLFSFNPTGNMAISERPMPFAVEAAKPTADWKPTPKLPSGSYVPEYGLPGSMWDDDYYTAVKPKDEKEERGIQFMEPELDDLMESMETECHEFLELLDDPETRRFADTESFAKAMASYAEEAAMTINEKYPDAYDQLPDKGRDTGGEAEPDRPLPACAQGMEKG